MRQGIMPLNTSRQVNLELREAMSVRVTAEKLTQPARLGSLRMEVTTPGLDPARQAGVLRAVNACLIHNTLSHPATVDVSVNEAERPAAA